MIRPLLQQAITTGLFLLFYSPFLTAQCTGSGTNSPGSVVNTALAGSDYTFSNPGNALSSNDNYATVSATLSFLSGITNYLNATGFGFSIPVSATICGIQVQVEKSAQGINAMANVTDYSIRLVKNNVITGNDYAGSANWTSTDTYSSYGGTNDLWGDAWTPADINDGNFGVVFAADIAGILSLLPTVQVDDILVTVYYTEITLPVNLVSFTATANKQQQVLLDWEADEQFLPASYTVQRSADGNHWNNLATLHSSSTGKAIHQYQFIDEQPLDSKNYYRLLAKSEDGHLSYSKTEFITLNREPGIRIFPNPFRSSLTLSGIHSTDKIAVWDVNGRLVFNRDHSGHNFLQLHLPNLQPGIYFMGVNDKRFMIYKE